MPHHHPKNTTEATSWCNTCRRTTLHRVDDRRLGVCLEHGRTGCSKRQQKERERIRKEQENPRLL